MNKKQAYDRLKKVMHIEDERDEPKTVALIKHLCDYHTTFELENLISFIKEENG